MKVKTILLGASLAVAFAAPASASHSGWEQFDSHLVPTIVGWGGYDLFSGHGLETTGIAFSNALHEGYVDLSSSRNAAWDKVDAEHFNQKARTAARRSDVLFCARIASLCHKYHSPVRNPQQVAGLSRSTARPKNGRRRAPT